MRLGLQPLGDQPLLVGRRHFDQRVGLVRLGNARRAVEDEGGRDVRLVEQQLGLQQFELEAHRPQVRAKQELGVLEGEPVGGSSVCGLSTTCSASCASTWAGRKTVLGCFGSVIGAD